MWGDSESILSSVNEYGVQNEGQEESKIQKLKLWRFRESEVKEKYAKGVSNNVLVIKIGVVWKEKEEGAYEHMEMLVNVENKWEDSIDASNVEGAVRRTEVEEILYGRIEWKWRKQVGPLGMF